MKAINNESNRDMVELTEAEMEQVDGGGLLGAATTAVTIVGLAALGAVTAPVTGAALVVAGAGIVATYGVTWLENQL